MRRRGHEVSDRTKEAARLQWHKDNPGNEDADLEVDHIIPVWYAIKTGIAPAHSTSGANARAMRQKEHKQRHRDEEGEDELGSMAQGVLGILGKLF